MAATEAPDRARGIVAWCLYDWANSAFATIVGTFVISVYFAQGIWGDAGESCGDQSEGAALWAFAIAIAGLVIAVLSPVLGAIADRTGRRKPWLAVCVAVAVVPTALLWFALPSREYALFALVCVAVASIGFELSTVFYNAMLPAIAPARMIGRISGWGWGLGYFGGLAALALCLVALVQPEQPWFGIPTENAANIRATAVLTAIWFTLFALPLFLFTRDTPATGIGALPAVRQGLAELAGTLRQIRRYGNVVRFLVASALYRDGLNTLFTVGGIYAACVIGMDFAQVILFAIGINVTAGIGAMAFAFVDDRVGSKPTVLVSVCGLCAFGLPLLFVETPVSFIALALCLGIFVGPTQAASRTLMARLAPPDMRNEMFGLYALTGRAVSIVGPAVFGLVATTFDSQRAGLSTILVVWVVGAALLLTVREQRAPSLA